MIKQLKIYTIVILITTTCQGQNPWQVNVGGVGKFPNYHVFESYDKGLMILAADYGVQHFHLIKTDANGKEIYSRRIKYEKPLGSKLSFASLVSISPTNDGGVLLCGGISPNDTFNNAFAAKLDACGDVEWNYILDDNISLKDGTYVNTATEISSNLFLLVGVFLEFDVLMTTDNNGNLNYQASLDNCWPNREIIQTHNKDFMISCGKFTHSFTDTSDTIGYYGRSMLIRTDSSGKLKWYNTYGLTDDSLGVASFSVEYNKNGNTYTQGSHSNPMKPLSINLTYLKKCDSMGNQVWHKNMGQQLGGKGKYFEEPRGIIKLKDDNLLLLESRDFDKYLNLSFARMIKVNPNGDVLDSITLGDSANFYTLTSGTTTYDSNFVVAYSYYHDNHYNGYIHLRKFNENLKQVKMDSSNFKYDSLCPHAVRTDDIDLSNAKVIKFNQDTNRIFKSHKYYSTVNAIPSVDGRPQLKVWPNPFNDWLKVNLAPSMDISLVQLYELNGKLVYEGRVQTNGLIQMGQLPQGLYILSLYNRNGDRWDAKLLKE